MKFTSSSVSQTYTGLLRRATCLFCRGEKVEDASASSFKYIGGGYGKDNWKVFYQGMVVKEASASSFEYSEDGYGKDNWNVFYRGRVVER